jgi:hypothetical protein
MSLIDRNDSVTRLTQESNSDDMQLPECGDAAATLKSDLRQFAPRAESVFAACIPNRLISHSA